MRGKGEMAKTRKKAFSSFTDHNSEFAFIID